MAEIYVYVVPIPGGHREIVLPCADGFTVYINDSLDQNGRIAALEHALWHIQNGDFEKERVQEIEKEAHERSGQ